MPTCKEVSRLASEALDSSLPLFKRIGLRMHNLFCKACSLYEKQMLFLRSAIRQYLRRAEKEEDLLPPVSLTPDARDRLKKALKEMPRS
jgi:hypothetical protein